MFVLQSSRTEGAVMDHFKVDHDAIERLWVRGILSDKEREKCHARLVKKVEAAP